MLGSILKGLKIFVKNKLKKEICIERFCDNNHILQVTDSYIPLYRRKKTRSIIEITPEDTDLGYSFRQYSVIYTSNTEKKQPYQMAKQIMFDQWAVIHQLKKVLVLGCAGCAMPRYFNLSYKDCETIGIEYSEKLISIANKYFLDGLDMNRFDLIHGDAFEYTQNYKGETFDAIYVDLFNGMDICQEVFSEKFLYEIYNMLSDNGIVVFNIIKGANTLRRQLNKIFPWAGYVKNECADSTAVAIKYVNISDVVKWKRNLLDNNWVWI